QPSGRQSKRPQLGEEDDHRLVVRESSKGMEDEKLREFGSRPSGQTRDVVEDGQEGERAGQYRRREPRLCSQIGNGVKERLRLPAAGIPEGTEQGSPLRKPDLRPRRDRSIGEPIAIEQVKVALGRIGSEKLPFRYE